MDFKPVRRVSQEDLGKKPLTTPMPVFSPTRRVTAAEFRKIPEEPGRAPVKNIFTEHPHLASNVGGAIGGISGLLTGSPAVSVLSAAGGGALGEKLYQDYLERKAPEYLANEPGKEILKAGLIQGGLEAVGGAAAGGLKMIAAPVAKGAQIRRIQEPLIREADTALKRTTMDLPQNKILGIEGGYGLTPEQLTESHVIDVLSNISEGSFLGGQAWKIRRTGQALGYKKMWDDFAKQMWSHRGGRATSEEVAQIFSNVRQFEIDAWKAANNRLYKSIDALNPMGPVVDIKPIKKFVAEHIEAHRAGGLSKLRAFQKRLSDLPDTLTFGEAKNLRTDIGDLKTSSEFQKDPSHGAFAKLYKDAADAMSKAGEKLSTDPTAGDAYKMYLEAVNHYKYGRERFFNDGIQQLVKVIEKNPSKVAEAAFQPNNPRNARRVMEMIGGNESLKNDLRAAWLESVMRQGGEELIGGKTLAYLQKMGQETLDEFLPKELQRKIRVIATTGKVLSEKAGVGGGMLIQLTQGAAIVSAAASPSSLKKPNVGKAVFTVLGGPYIISKLMLHPQYSKWFIDGLRTPVGTKEAALLAVRLHRAVDKIREEDKKKKAPKVEEAFRGAVKASLYGWNPPAN